MSDTNETDLRGRIAHLERVNAGLANQIVRSSERLEESRRELLATGWDAAVDEADRRWQIGSTSASILKADNPYRKPIGLGGAQQ
ncbi:hypothetical protein ABC337_04915 [Arthrobacter sp. 1P04PC]|uniref:hypothetical protein n=1 Tax=unclassified Arthrobacter TaxID=235627 RepID=UPI00399F4EE0